MHLFREVLFWSARLFPASIFPFLLAYDLGEGRELSCDIQQVPLGSEKLGPASAFPGSSRTLYAAALGCSRPGLRDGPGGPGGGPGAGTPRRLGRPGGLAPGL